MPVSKKKILVVDDSNTNVVLLEAVFSSEGYTILTALSAREAFLIIGREKPEIILLDLNMPGISGYDFLEQIKSDEQTKDIPIVVVSALTSDESVKKAFARGAIEFIKKPIDIQLLQKRVSEILKADFSNDGNFPKEGK